MILQFKQQTTYGKIRHYPTNDAARAVVALTGRVCLKIQELAMLEMLGGFKIEISEPETGGTNAAT